MFEKYIEEILDEHSEWDRIYEDVTGRFVDWDAGIKCSCGRQIPPKDEGSLEDWHREHVSEVLGALFEKRFKKRYGLWIKDGGTGSERVVPANTRRAAEIFASMNPHHESKVMSCWASDWTED